MVKQQAAAEAKAKDEFVLRDLKPIVPPTTPPDSADAADPVPKGSVRRAYMADTNGAGALEDVPGFNAYKARNWGLFEAAPNGAAAGSDGSSLQNVIGRDDRVTISDTTDLPWRCIALLSITYGGGHRSLGTAWFCGPKALATAGHNVHHPEHGPAQTIMVSPAYDGVKAPFGTYPAARMWCPAVWSARHDPASDYGAILLADATVGSRLGWFGYAAYHDDRLTSLLVNVSGYPSDKSVRTQYYNGGRLAGLEAQFLHYEFDTENGMSGSPIFALFGRQRIAVGIHTSGDAASNRACRIDQDVFDALNHMNSLPG